MKKNDNGMILFRDARKGYRKEDVNHYIEEMNLQFSMTEEALNGTIRRLEQELAQKADGDPTVIEALRRENERLQKENESLRCEKDRLTEERSALRGQITEQEKTAPVGASSALSYDEASRRLGDILLKANLDADRIVAAAAAAADRQLAGAEKRADDIRLDAAVMAKLTADRVKQRLTTLTADYLEHLNALSAHSAEEYQKLCDDLNDKLLSARSRVEAELKKIDNGDS